MKSVGDDKRAVPLRLQLAIAVKLPDQRRQHGHDMPIDTMSINTVTMMKGIAAGHEGRHAAFGGEGRRSSFGAVVRRFLVICTSWTWLRGCPPR